MPRSLVITGGTGLLGGTLLEHLPRDHWSVTLLTRHPDAARKHLPPGVRPLLWSPGMPGAWMDVVAAADAVVHLAGASVGESRWTPAVRQRILESRAIGTRAIAEAMAAGAARGRVLVSASGVGYYGDTGEREIDESAPAGTDFLAQVCVAWEQALDVAARTGVRTVALRMGVVLSHRGGALPRMLPPFRLGVGGPLGHGRQWFPWIHEDDAAGLFLLAMTDPSMSGPVNGTAPGLVRNAEFMRALGRAMRRPALLHVPAFALRAVVGGFADTLLTGQRAIPAAALAAGYRFRYPELDAALAAALRSGR